MTGESSLNKLIVSMEPLLFDEEYVFCTIAPDRRNFLSIAPIMEFHEKEGITLILRKDEAEKSDLSFIYPCKMITLNIHSSLEAIGFLAAITKKLASSDINVNAVSAYYHDHIFVPIGKAEKVMSLLKELSAEFKFSD